MKFSRKAVEDQLRLLHEEAEERDAQRRAEREGYSYLDLRGRPIDLAVLGLIAEKEAKAARAAAIEAKGKKLALALYSSQLPAAKSLIQSLAQQGYQVVPFIVSLSSLSRVWERYAAVAKEAKRGEIVAEVNLREKFREFSQKAKNINEVASLLSQLTVDLPTTEVIASILSGALVLGVSDVHLEPTNKEKTLIRFRVDGVLRDIALLSHHLGNLLVARLKLLAKLKLNVRDLPQDGRFTIESDRGPVEVRVSVVPAEFGESVVMRVLSSETIALALADLGLRADDEEIIRRELKRPNGMILVTGPTGSGKTTTLYAFLKKIKTPAIKVITIEDPIEYHLEDIEQTQIDPEGGYGFAAALRSALRQDPDVILVGEIRDLETAETAIHAALTGHLVFSTLHTNDAAGAIPRLIDLGVRPSVIGPALNLVVAQRLVRRLCPRCRKEIAVPEEEKTKIKNFLNRLPKRVLVSMIEIKLYQAVGCDQCTDGYRERIGIFEILEMGAGLDQLIKKTATESEIRKAAIEEQGMVLMQEDGVLKSLLGITTLEEVERATGPIDW
jgi:type II secretory ATPase GspE/PulE/Tfp pilus assembly ATPase PilB-like protein